MSALHRQCRSGVAAVLLALFLGTSLHSTSAFLSVAPKTSSSLVPQSSSRHVPLHKSPDICHRAGNRSGSGGNNGGSPTALSALPVPNLSSVAKFYKTFPIVAGFLTASTKACFADSLAQYRDVCTTKFDVRRNLAMVLYSGCILGATCEVMYNRIFPLIFGATTPETGLALAVKMTLFDGFLNAPLLWLPPAYIAQALVYRYPKRDAIRKYVTDVRENGLLKKYWSLWLPASLINFCFVPAHFRILFVASVSFFWMIILSIVANNDQDVESCPLEPEPAMLNPRALD
eukprot:CAMPEP_0172533360 /NCGR_PEP_ID=MMETSP1067-20121228/6092_1 /TAXON_ID=265564 ORGANISM="Thalassiosira punctigera, Strain Tpunct2005C2" /NCGR_SAMPLE_ID=MMETSP1067 /ASSEMBLY_ACC=CAM_ASM_000444 /LENGTH=287 /DNA_ID=CAMNT_0013317995 /DNA_START=60 /DNA_END=923 /DNA_ORIENTATION=-